MYTTFSRQTLAQYIAETPNDLLKEPDMYQLVQSYWEDGLELFDYALSGQFYKSLDKLIDGPWTNEELQDHYEQILRVQGLIL